MRTDLYRGSFDWTGADFYDQQRVVEALNIRPETGPFLSNGGLYTLGELLTAEQAVQLEKKLGEIKERLCTPPSLATCTWFECEADVRAFFDICLEAVTYGLMEIEVLRHGDVEIRREQRTAEGAHSSNAIGDYLLVPSNFMTTSSEKLVCLEAKAPKEVSFVGNVSTGPNLKVRKHMAQLYCSVADWHRSHLNEKKVDRISFSALFDERFMWIALTTKAEGSVYASPLIWRNFEGPSLDGLFAIAWLLMRVSPGAEVKIVSPIGGDGGDGNGGEGAVGESNDRKGAGGKGNDRKGAGGGGTRPSPPGRPSGEELKDSAALGLGPAPASPVYLRRSLVLRLGQEEASTLDIFLSRLGEAEKCPLDMDMMPPEEPLSKLR